MRTANQSNDKIVKAGTLMYATLDHAINSEDPAPILATVMNGPLQGATIMGEFKQEEEKLVLKFNKVNIETEEMSLPIELFAVDVNTARNVSIDSHFILKYGALFASSFLEGLNEVAGALGTSVSTNGNTTVVKQGSLDKSKVVAAGLGKVGENLVEATQSLQDKKPTIRMKVGSTFGILVMQDFTKFS
nr:DotG/IcmE/VirB10 family protein [Candidatus Synchoanobacter obligatus]